MFAERTLNTQSPLSSILDCCGQLWHAWRHPHMNVRRDRRMHCFPFHRFPAVRQQKEGRWWSW